MVSAARAEKTLVSVKDITIEGGLDIGGSAFYLPNVNFGAGSYAARSGGRYNRAQSPTYGELYGKPILSGRWDLGQGISIIGKASALGAATLGHGDAQEISQTSGTPRSIYLEEANIGVTLPVHLAGKSQQLTVLGGRQAFAVDDGFLIGKGTYSAGSRGAWWYAPRFAFSGPGVIKLEGNPVRADIFMLESNADNDIDWGNDRPKTKFVGFDVSWFRNTPGGHGESTYADRAAYVTLTYFHVRDADTSSHYDYSARGDRNGMNVASLSWGGTLVPFRPLGISKNFTFYGSFVSQQNSHAGNGYKSVEAYGMYFEPGYRFTMLPWQPQIFYRYTRYGGNKNPNGTVKHSYDTFFLYDGKRYTYGGYWPGEIVGMYLAPLSDLEVHQLDLTATPPVHLFSKGDSLKLGLHYYDLSLLYPSGVGLKSGGRHISDELDATAEYTLNATTSAALAGGVAFAGPAGRALAHAGVPGGYPVPDIGHHAGIIEAYFYKHF
ncbi:alginate export family protein [Acetobacter tropicalis]